MNSQTEYYCIYIYIYILLFFPWAAVHGIKSGFMPVWYKSWRLPLYTLVVKSSSWAGAARQQSVTHQQSLAGKPFGVRKGNAASCRVICHAPLPTHYIGAARHSHLFNPWCQQYKTPRCLNRLHIFLYEKRMGSRVLSVLTTSEHVPRNEFHRRFR